MPTFDFTSPDGKSYSVQGPDGATPEQAFQMLQQHLGAPQVGMGEDAAKSVASGLGSAAIGTIGAVGDIRSLLSQGVDAAGSRLGFDPSMLKRAAGTVFSALNDAPTSKDVRATVTDPIVDPDYKPQYLTGSLLKKGAEFAPNMLLGGPEGTAARFLTNVAAPAVGREIGESVAGPFGGVAGALAVGVGATSAARRFQEMAAARNAAKAVPSGDQLLKSGGAGFEAVKASDAIIKPSSVEQMAKDIKTELLNDGKHPTIEGQAGLFSTLDRLEAMGASGGGVTPKDMEVIRKNLVGMKTALDPSAAGAARQATNSFMEKYSNLGQSDLLNGSNPFPTLKNAIADWAAGKRSQTIQGKMNLADLNAGSPVGALDSGTTGQALQRTMKQLARPRNNTNEPVARRLGFNDREVGAITDAAMGNKMTHAAELMDRLIPAKLGAIPAMVARQIGGLSTKRQVSSLDSLVRSRSPLAAHVAAQLPPQLIQQLPTKTQRLLQSLVLADQALRNQPGQPVGQSGSY